MESSSSSRICLGSFAHGWVRHLFLDPCISVPKLLPCSMIFLPESPRWLLANGKNEECLKALRSIAGEKNRTKAGFIEAEYQDIELLVNEAAAAGKSSFFSSFNPRGKALYRTMLGFLLMVCQQLTGANYFFYYGMSDIRTTRFYSKRR